MVFLCPIIKTQAHVNCGKLKPKHMPTLSQIKTIGAVLLLAFSFYAYGKIKDLKAENTRVTDNYQNALKIDSLEVAVFKITSKKELEDLLNQNNNLKQLVAQSEVSTSRIQSLFYQQQKYLDSVTQKIDVSPIVQNIRANIPTITPWKDSTACAIIKGNITYQADSLSVNITSKEFNNNVVLIKHQGRREPVKWLFNIRLGKRDINFTPQTTCGTTKVTIIENESN